MSGTFQNRIQENDESSSQPALKLAYPSDLITAHGYFMEICALKSVFGDGNPTGNRNDRGVETGRESVASIYLPIPVNFSEGKQEHSYDTKASVGGTLLTTLGPVVQAFAGSRRQNWVTGAATTIGNAYNGLSTLSQEVFNPGYYVAYQRPEYRQHEFAWAFAPRNEVESNIVANIVRWMKFYSSPAKKDMSLNFLYPNEFRMRFLFSSDGADAQDIFEPRLQTGYVAGIEVNHYNDNGNPVGFFTDTKHPALTTLAFTFIENELVYKNDFKGLETYDQISEPTSLPPFDDSNPDA